MSENSGHGCLFGCLIAAGIIIFGGVILFLVLGYGIYDFIKTDLEKDVYTVSEDAMKKSAGSFYTEYFLAPEKSNEMYLGKDVIVSGYTAFFEKDANPDFFKMKFLMEIDINNEDGTKVHYDLDKLTPEEMEQVSKLILSNSDDIIPPTSNINDFNSGTDTINTKPEADTIVLNPTDQKTETDKTSPEGTKPEADSVDTIVFKGDEQNTLPNSNIPKTTTKEAYYLCKTNSTMRFMRSILTITKKLADLKAADDVDMFNALTLRMTGVVGGYENNAVIIYNCEILVP